jgi:hypothetical protein
LILIASAARSALCFLCKDTAFVQKMTADCVIREKIQNKPKNEMIQENRREIKKNKEKTRANEI